MLYSFSPYFSKEGKRGGNVFIIRDADFISKGGAAREGNATEVEAARDALERAKGQGTT